MAVKLITSKGEPVGYQAVVGPRSATLSRFFSLKKYGKMEARKRAQAAEQELAAKAQPIRPRTGARTAPQRNNRSGIVGIRPRQVAEGLVIVATWSDRGRSGYAAFSVNTYGLLGAIERAIDRRETETGVKLNLTARQAWNRMKEAIEQLAA